MDLAPGKSFAEWAVSAATPCSRSATAIPTSRPRRRLRRLPARRPAPGARRHAGRSRARSSQHRRRSASAARCTRCSLAYLAAGRRPTGSAPLTLLNTLLDFAEPGPLGAFVDARRSARLEKRMEKRGYLDARRWPGRSTSCAPTTSSGTTCERLADGREPAGVRHPRRGTRTRRGCPPACTPSTSLACYLENRLAKGTMRARRPHLGSVKVRVDAYVVAAEEDHITPWRGCYTPDPAARAAPCASSSRRPVTSQASSIRPSPKRRLPRQRGAAGRPRRSGSPARTSRGLVVGRLGDVDRRASRRAAQAAAAREQRAPAARGRARHLRARDEDHLDPPGRGRRGRISSGPKPRG